MKLKKWFEVRQFFGDSRMIYDVNGSVKVLGKSFYKNGILLLQHCVADCVELKKVYVEKLI